MIDHVLTGILLIAWLPALVWAAAWWDLGRRKTRGAEALNDRVTAWATETGQLKTVMADLVTRDHATQAKIKVLEQNLREAGLNPKTPLSKQAGMMPFGKRG